MKSRLAGSLFFLVMWLGMSFPLAPAIWAQTNAPTEDSALAAADKEGCIRNLKLIYDAIQAYQIDHKDLPNWLSDLVPQYINDANVLICPVCKRTGQAESSKLSDPNIPSSYYFEFCPVPLGKQDAPGDPTRTRREWKRRQMGLVGAVVPLVRCRHHPAVLNLAYDGKIYESPAAWETLFTNQVNLADLSSRRIFPGRSKANTTTKLAVAPDLTFPPRDPHAKPGLLNLTPYYNAMLTESWHGGSSNNLASLPTGAQTFAGTEFDVRGIIQLGSKSDSAKRFPAQVKGIKVHRKCERLTFLHAVGFGAVTDEGRQVGSYVVHFATNQMQLEIPIYYGHDVRNWHSLKGEKPGAKELTVAWIGANAVSQAAKNSIRLFKTAWINPAPGVEIESVDFISTMGTPAPFLIAITAE